MKLGGSLGNIPQILKKKTCNKNSIYFEMLGHFQEYNLCLKWRACTLENGLTVRGFFNFCGTLPLPVFVERYPLVTLLISFG
jgi:hypothetical protein